MSAAAVVGHHSLNVGGPFGVYGLQFGSGKYVSTSTAITGNASRTYLVFVKPTKTLGYAWGTAVIPIFCSGTTATNQDFTLRYYGSITASSCYLAFNGWSNDFNHYITLEAEVWTCIVVTYDGAKVKLFVNGVQPISGTGVPAEKATTALNTATGPLRFGTDHNGNSTGATFAGFRVETVALTATQIQSTMSTLLPPHASLYAQWPLTEGNGATADDNSGNNRTLTLVGSPVWVGL
ncbi:LamG-like jellyroll fold domain-containing protein [Hymenobacter sp. ASUV-10]|uniref:LamG-like jellyroll fold domain-containing protein n=1 Tax=Hymenobacter aranciens TaxID=3063996 RepID=A0ABT9BEB9_9BACT|nr:LamG-like jellyroll fold domain-containing protein [Hymenobacter sp. ASUV-10]MDO7876008.1 LamG-like jellyroll fold domain-containing protein [Hymenobacter sp. ASUV-10]